MRFINHDESILPQQSGLEAAMVDADFPITRKQQSATDHINRANDDCRARGIKAPFAVVSFLPT